MKKLLLLLLSTIGCTASTVYTCGLISAFGTQPSGTLVFYPVAGTYGTNIETTLSQSVSFSNGCFTNLTLTGGNYEVDYYNRMLLNIFVPFNDLNNWQLTDLATNLTSYVTFGQLGVFSNNVYAAALLAGQASSVTAVTVLSNYFSNLLMGSTNYLATNFTVISNTPFTASTFYTNTYGKRSQVSVALTITAGAGNTPTSSIYVGTPGAWSYTNTISMSGTSGLSETLPLTAIVGPSQVFVFTNTVGGGTITINSTNCSWIGF